MCPDSGTLSSDCLYCECTNTISGQILSNLGQPLQNATISPQLAPDTILATSAVGGMFELANVCSEEIYSVSATGFVSLELTLDPSSFANITLEEGSKNTLILP